jgi:16S rRNA (cytidine1402-2'-O)-methyltransferase
LYLVATPIGNLDDLSHRAVRTLAEADIIAAEDTRKTGQLLKHFGVTPAQLRSYHDFNEERAAADLLVELQAGKAVALVSNAGTPTVSDPGYRLLRAALDNNIEVTAVPGACAAITALSVSGLPVHRFVFLGFPPKKPGKLRNFLSAEKEQAGSLIFYESPQRLGKFLAAAYEVFGARRAVVCRELTKLFEEKIRGTLEELAARFAQLEPKGEIVVVIEGITGKTVSGTRESEDQEGE